MNLKEDYYNLWNLQKSVCTLVTMPQELHNLQGQNLDSVTFINVNLSMPFQMLLIHFAAAAKEWRITFITPFTVQTFQVCEIPLSELASIDG